MAEPMLYKMLNLFTDNSLEAVWSAAYMQALARHLGAGISVFHCEDDTEMKRQIVRLSRMIYVCRTRTIQLPKRGVYFSRLMPALEDVELLRKADPSIVFNIIDMTVPVEQVVKLDALLSRLPRDEAATICANAVYEDYYSDYV